MPFPSSDHPLGDDDRTPIEVLARILLARELCISADRGRPLVLKQREREVRRVFLELAKDWRPSWEPFTRAIQRRRCLDAIEAPWPRREEKLLEFALVEERSRYLVEAVERIGAEPFEPPEPLPPIRHDDVQLICWLAIEGEGADRVRE